MPFLLFIASLFEGISQRNGLAIRALRSSCFVWWLGMAACACFAQASAPAGIPEYTYEIVHAYPHDKQAFTEGLFYLNGFLYESTGLKGHSSIRKVELATGRVVQQAFLAPEYFGEGIVAWKGRLLQLTYTTQTGFVYDLAAFSQRRTFAYTGEGWSLASDGRRILMDDGTPQIRFWDAETLKETGRLTVTAGGVPVDYLNEMEWVDGSIYANVWHTDRIAIISPDNGKVQAWIDLAGLLPDRDRLSGSEGQEQVLNGIAYDPGGHRLFVTGKYWPTLFEIKLKRRSK